MQVLLPSGLRVYVSENRVGGVCWSKTVLLERGVCAVLSSIEPLLLCLGWCGE